MNTAPLINMHKICKKFGRLWANRNVSLQVMEGEIHVLAGENGAGKSTLMKVLFGLLQADGGTIYLNGRPTSFRHPREALQAGIAMVQQQLLIFPQLSALENIALGAESHKWGVFKREATRRKLYSLSRIFGFDLPLKTMAGELSFAHRQQIELLRVLYRGARILILDEPTSLLAPPEVEKLLGLLKALKTQGHTIIFISHRLREVFAIGDRITVLRKGESLGTWSADRLSPEQVAAKIAEGKQLITAPRNGTRQAAMAPQSDQAVLSLQHLTVNSHGMEIGLEDFSLQIRDGEILGLGGVVGNGQRMLARFLAGLEPAAKGRMFFRDRDITGFSVARLGGMGIRWLPENCLEEGSLPELSLWENMLLGFQRHPSCQSWGWLQKDCIRNWTRQRLNSGKVAYADLEQPLKSLSGGNQQKLMLSRTLSGHPQLVILEQPGRGLDVHAQQKMHAKVKSLNAEGVAFVVFSYDLEELLSLSHRVGILYRGRLMGLVSSDQADRNLLGEWMLGLSARDG